VGKNAWTNFLWEALSRKERQGTALILKSENRLRTEGRTGGGRVRLAFLAIDSWSRIPMVDRILG